ncbi:shikimate kinase [Rhodohalobacter mucosus]|uniref:Shikimate kinase n=1 Tax=Rhodohalobacter mucosus TaxID=2079485 RepID=A0A316TRB2_9BACT|nr:shikimate kinase [Rhodohalobacter mucosus]PWN06231.1 hypothetical protein DDZ15_10400 [Rhodohalobacter mucosus]
MNVNIKPIKQAVFLCGMMGSGKTTVGKELAKLLNVSFHDLDRLIEQRTGNSIPEIFKTEGEEAFRKIERETILDVTASLSGVIALGGGSLQNQHLTDHIKLNGWLVFIQTPIDDIAERLHRKDGRPMIAENSAEKSDLFDKISSLMEQRIPYYSQAHLTIKTGDLTPPKIAAVIVDKLAFYEQRHRS